MFICVFQFRYLIHIMYRITRNLASHFFSSRKSTTTTSSRTSVLPHAHQRRGIMVKVFDGNVELALAQMTRKMRESGMENLLKKKGYFERWMCDHHVKDSKRKYVNRRAIQYRIRNQELFKTLKTLLAKQMRLVNSRFYFTFFFLHPKTTSIFSYFSNCSSLFRTLDID